MKKIKSMLNKKNNNNAYEADLGLAPNENKHLNLKRMRER